MFNNLRRIRELNEQIVKLETKVSNLKDELTSKDTTIAAREEIIAQSNRAMRKSSFMFNFDLVPVFSIERLWRGDRAVTSIGFINRSAKENEKQLVEWVFDCDETVHEELCVKWKAWKKDV